MTRSLCTLALFAMSSPVFAAPALPVDPLGSPMWEYHAAKLFGGDPVVFDDRVRVILPVIAEDQRVMPVTVDGRAVGKVQRIVLLADLNPIPVAFDYRPVAAAPYVGARIKLDQRTPVRAAVQTADGTWHISGAWVDAAGGGCSAPPVSRVKGDWADHLGEIRGAAWIDGRDTRVRLSFRHPMDTGLVENIPAYNIDTLRVTGADGSVLAEMTIHGSVSEDPAFSLLLAPASPGRLTVFARDTSGLEFVGSLESATGRQLAALNR